MRWKKRRVSMRSRMSGGCKKNLNIAAFNRQGYWIWCGAIDHATITRLASEFSENLVGKRIFRSVGPLRLPSVSDQLRNAVRQLTQANALPVRMIYFDKSKDSNWSLGWHQDRTIAVKKRQPVDGFEIWTTKNRVPHVEPPFEVLEKSITVRISIDNSNDENGALEVIAGSHLHGRLSDSETNDLVSNTQSTLLDTKAGDVIFLKAPILHRSAKSKSKARRRVVQIDYSWAQLPSPLQWAFEA